MKEDSIHFSITSFVWKKYLVSGKLHACIYWQILLPTSLILGAVFAIMVVAITTIEFFFGNIPNFNGKEGEAAFCRHRRKANGEPWPRFIPAPYQVVTPVVLVFLLYVLVTDYTWIAIYSLIGLVALAAIGGVLRLVSKNWNQPFLRVPREVATRSIDSGWNRICPMLVIEPKPSGPESDLIEPSESTA